MRFRYSVDFEAVIYATLNLTRASVPAAKVADTTGASSWSMGDDADRVRGDWVCELSQA
jgi:hypothetical protein